MANPEHFNILKNGYEVWNAWRRLNPNLKPNLSGIGLRAYALKSQFFRSENGFRRADLSGFDFSETDLHSCDLSGVILIETNFREANLCKTDLRDAYFRDVNLSQANISEADMGWTTFSNTDLSEAQGLETVHHSGPSTIGIDTIFLSKGNIPEIFLRRAGAPKEFITYMPSLTAQSIEFYSCFISYSHKDEELARRLYSRMREANLRVWYAPEEIKGGLKLYDQIDRAIQIHDRLLLVLSEHSMKSEWVKTEILRARKSEQSEQRRKLYPIRLVDFQVIQEWESFDVDTGRDLAVELRQYFIPDFSNWKDHDSFEKAFERLLRDLKAEERSK